MVLRNIALNLHFSFKFRQSTLLVIPRVELTAQYNKNILTEELKCHSFSD